MKAEVPSNVVGDAKTQDAKSALIEQLPVAAAAAETPDSGHS
jgi:hypothetical protein